MYDPLGDAGDLVLLRRPQIYSDSLKGTTMESILFEVVTKATAILVSVVALIWWFNAGCPFVTITKVKR